MALQPEAQPAGGRLLGSVPGRHDGRWSVQGNRDGSEFVAGDGVEIGDYSGVGGVEGRS